MSSVVSPATFMPPGVQQSLSLFLDFSQRGLVYTCWADVFIGGRRVQHVLFWHLSCCVVFFMLHLIRRWVWSHCIAELFLQCWCCLIILLIETASVSHYEGVTFPFVINMQSLGWSFMTIHTLFLNHISSSGSTNYWFLSKSVVLCSLWWFAGLTTPCALIIYNTPIFCHIFSMSAILLVDVETT